jgi:hypothetical protein
MPLGCGKSKMRHQHLIVAARLNLQAYLAASREPSVAVTPLSSFLTSDLLKCCTRTVHLPRYSKHRASASSVYQKHFSFAFPSRIIINPFRKMSTSTSSTIAFRIEKDTMGEVQGKTIFV